MTHRQERLVRRLVSLAGSPVRLTDVLAEGCTTIEDLVARIIEVREAHDG